MNKVTTNDATKIFISFLMIIFGVFLTCNRFTVSEFVIDFFKDFLGGIA